MNTLPTRSDPVQLDVSAAAVPDVYQLLVGLVTPRPIAWVSTVSPTGVANLAPFSFFNVFGANPPVVVFSPTRRRDGTVKDTLRHLDATPEFVINTATADLADKVNLSSKEVPADESEFALTGLTPTPAARVKPPRVAEAAAHLECRVRQIIPVGDGPISANLVIGEVVFIHVRDDVLDARGRVDPRQLRTVARLGGDFWGHTSDLFELPRP